MSNTYKGGQGDPPSPCYDAPPCPNTGASPPDGPVLYQSDSAMVAAADPFATCCPPCSCPSGSCSPGGSPGGPSGGSPPPFVLSGSG
jgi:hypothetical protein